MSLALAAIAVAVGTGCGGVNEPKSIASARGLLDKREYQSAVIELKTLLQANPNSGEARYLLGAALLGAGDPVAAAIELKRAADLAYAGPMLVVAQARAALQQGQHKAVIEQFSAVQVADPRAKAELDAVMATALAVDGRVAEAKKRLASALAAVADLREGQLLQARILAFEGDVPGAIALLDQLTSRDARDAQAWQLKGDILNLVADKQAGAAEAYRKAVAIDKKLAAAHVGLIQSLMRSNDLAGAHAAQQAMVAVLPGSAHALFYGAQIAFLRNELDAAHQGGQALLKSFPEEVRVLQLVGLIDLKRHSHKTAENYLKRALQLAPESAWTRRLLGQAFVAQGQPAQALEVLRPVVASTTAEAEVLELAAEALLQSGDVGGAERLYTRAAQRNPNEVRIKTTLAVTRLVKGDAAGGFRELEELAAANPSSDAPDLAIIAGRLRRNEVDAALKAIDALEIKRPKQALPFVLRGRAHLMRTDIASARKSFEQALAIQPDNFPATATLAALDLAEKKPAQAAQRFEALLKRDPTHYQAQLALADLKSRSGAPAADVIAMYNEAIKWQPQQSRARLMLHAYLLSQRKDVKQALQVAQEGAAALPDDADMLDALARSQLASGDPFQAISSFRKVIAMVPNSPEPHLRLADAHVARRDYDSAVQSLAKALEIAPDLDSARRGLATLALRRNRYPEALAVAKDMQKRNPTSGVGYVFEGDIEATRKNWDAAAAAYRLGMAKAPLAEMAPKLHALLIKAGRTEEAARFKTERLSLSPPDVAFLYYVAQNELLQRRFAEAEPLFEQVVKLDPSRVMAMNNLAWLKIQLKKPGAVELAEKANAMRPDSPALMDTLALALAADGKLDRAITLEKQAVDLAPEGHQYRLNLARFMVQAGDKAGAREHLEQLSRHGDKFARQDEVRSLLSQAKP